MKRLLNILVVVCLFTLSSANITGSHTVNAQQTVPSYAKWGQLAMKTAKERYPDGKILDYLHIGREKKENTSVEKFKLWVEDKGKEFGLYINIEFDEKTEKVINVNIKKSNN